MAILYYSDSPLTFSLHLAPAHNIMLNAIAAARRMQSSCANLPRCICADSFLTCAEEAMFLWQSVCVQNISKSYKRILMKFFGRRGREGRGVWRGRRTNRLNFCGDTDHDSDPGFRIPGFVDRNPDRGIFHRILYLLLQFL